MSDPFNTDPETMIGWEMHSLSECISELTRWANDEKDILRRDLFDLKIHHNRLALIISALEAGYLQAAE